MRSVAQARADTLERSQALAAVIRFRTDLKRLRPRLALATASGRKDDQELSHRLNDAVNEKEAALHDAVAFCMVVASDLLTDHDAQAAAAEQADRDGHEAQEALYEIERQASLAKSNEAAQARLVARRRIEAEVDQPTGALATSTAPLFSDLSGGAPFTL
jgi:hypothetical protein